MAASRNYSSTAGLMHLVGSITGAAASLIVDVTTGLPTVPFTLMLDPGLSVEEIVTVTAAGGTTLTVTRGVGGTGAQAHDNGVEVRHAYYGADFQDSRNHEAATTGHGATGAVVGTTNTQTLTGKTMSGSSNTFSNIPTTAMASVVAFSQSAGSVNIVLADALTGTAAVVFPTGRFTQIPLIAAMRVGNGATFNPNVLSLTATGCTISVQSTTDRLTGTITVHWHAVQMTSASAAG